MPALRCSRITINIKEINMERITKYRPVPERLGIEAVIVSELPKSAALCPKLIEFINRTNYNSIDFRLVTVTCSLFDYTIVLKEFNHNSERCPFCPLRTKDEYLLEWVIHSIHLKEMNNLKGE